MLPPGEPLLAAAFQQHYGQLCRLAGRLMDSHESAEDLVQEAFVRAAHRLSSVEQSAHGAYLRQTLVNLWRSSLKRRRLETHARRMIEPLVTEAVEYSDPDLPRVWRAVKGLPDRQRLCVVLRYSLDLSDGQIAESLSCSIGTVKKQMHRALARLRRELDDEP